MGLLPEDRLLTINGKVIERGVDLEEEILQVGIGETFELQVRRGEQVVNLTWQLDPRQNPLAEAREAPVHEVTLDPFFISKFEMTQGQWQRFTGDNPSIFNPSLTEIPGVRFSMLHPVEFVSWNAVAGILPKLGLDFPTEAQFEYAMRGGTETIWWAGNDRESLRGVANLADKTFFDMGPPGFETDHESWLRDGHAWHAPIGTFRPNPYGLHELIGNVGEMCREWLGDYENGVAPGDGERQVAAGARRTARGGSYQSLAINCRTTFRGFVAPLIARASTGIRPVRRLDGKPGF